MLGLGLLLGGASVGAMQVAAQQNSALATATVQTQNAAPKTTENSANEVADSVENKNESATEKDDDQALIGTVKITVDEAKKAAEAKVGGTASEAELGDENGTPTYDVKVGNKDVKVDANSGKVLGVEKDDANENESANEQNDANESAD